MNELLKINYEAEQPTVSARDLHEALEIRERFSLWFSRYVDVFEKGTDYQSVGKPTVVNNGASNASCLHGWLGVVPILDPMG